jgi:hypothetical protein
MRIETTNEEVQQCILEVLRGCRDGRGMDKESLHAACRLMDEIADLQAAVRLLQRGEILGMVDADGEVVLQAKDVVANDQRTPKKRWTF